MLNLVIVLAAVGVGTIFSGGNMVIATLISAAIIAVIGVWAFKRAVNSKYSADRRMHYEMLQRGMFNWFVTALAVALIFWLFNF